MPTPLEVKCVPLSEDLLHPGEFVFIPTREPIRKFHSEPLQTPTGAGLSIARLAISDSHAMLNLVGNPHFFRWGYGSGIAGCC
jgi:hypothetical protein